MNTKLHAVCDSQGRPISLFVTAGQVSDYIGARGYDADWFKEALRDKRDTRLYPGS